MSNDPVCPSCHVVKLIWDKEQGQWYCRRQDIFISDDELESADPIPSVEGWKMMPSGYLRWKCPACGDENQPNSPISDNEFCNQCGREFRVGYPEVRWSVRVDPDGEI